MNKLIIIFFVCFQIAYSDNFLLFKPISSYVFEPRIGSAYNLNDKNLRLDIGASFDLIKFKDDYENSFAIGADFFTYTRLRSENNFTFPVETSDYFFGLNFSTDINLFNTKIQSRLRVAHISSHLIDGFSKDGVFFKMPFVYSREFVELFITKYVELSDRLVLRPHIGFTGVFSTAPDDIAPLIGRVGFDLNYNLNQHIEFLVGTSVSNGEIDANISTQMGVNLRFIQNTGLFIGYYNYYGSSIHGMFYKNRDNYSAIGFQIIYN